MKVDSVFLLLSFLVAAHSSAVSGYGAGVEPIAFPIKVAEGKHTFADAKGNSFFWLGTTQWELFRGYSEIKAEKSPPPAPAWCCPKESLTALRPFGSVTG